jgi:hypothetical protein
MAQSYLAALHACPDFSAEFEGCVDALTAHINLAAGQIARLG